MRRAGEKAGTRIAKDALWLAIGVFFLVGLVRAVISLLSGGLEGMGPLGVVWLVLGALVTYWIGMGAIRRTSWMQRRHQMREEQTRTTLS